MESTWETLLLRLRSYFPIPTRNEVIFNDEDDEEEYNEDEEITEVYDEEVEEDTSEPIHEDTNETKQPERSEETSSTTHHKLPQDLLLCTTFYDIS
jgi:hypothetical protein